jgi:hypothetical protein
MGHGTYYCTTLSEAAVTKGLYYVSSKPKSKRPTSHVLKTLDEAPERLAMFGKYQ